MEIDAIEKLAATIKDRKIHPKEGSYTNSLFNAGENKIVKKLGEENAEFIKAFLTEPKDRIVGEAADIIYHLMVALEYKDIDFNELLLELKSRAR
ncbi:MAG: phosphoribosyl-ATP diphosphatase [Calditerrivibrio sp.]|nr:phosphoribosyl-ATP diphosphatase [Calditerrivibrio sp.]MCA1980601.1 phosphoribosyl-ATP diphosphatase [Calditerrivibrio sp.]